MPLSQVLDLGLRFNMTHRRFVASDHHFGHDKILTFVHDGKPLRDFATIKEHDLHIVEMHNSVVRPQDTTYFLGDVVINQKNLWMLGKMNGRKILIKGNHDIFALKYYVPYFEDIRAAVPTKCRTAWMTHVPVHTDNLYRFKINIHGHTHGNLIKDQWGKPDQRYINVCMEHINYTPIEIEAITSTWR